MCEGMAWAVCFEVVARCCHGDCAVWHSVTDLSEHARPVPSFALGTQCAMRNKTLSLWHTPCLTPECVNQDQGHIRVGPGQELTDPGQFGPLS